MTCIVALTATAGAMQPQQFVGANQHNVGVGIPPAKCAIDRRIDDAGELESRCKQQRIA